MKVAVSSAAFRSAISTGTLTQLEWLDLAANELEADGVVFDVRDFPRSDAEYLAQLKKIATDLGLTVAAVAAGPDAFEDAAALAIASALAAPVLVMTAPEATEDPDARVAAIVSLKARARDAKRLGVVLALRNVSGTLCASLDALRRLAYDVDSSWLRFALDPLQIEGGDDPAKLLAQTAIACADIGEPSSFAKSGDERAKTIAGALERFRGFVVLEGDASHGNAAYHGALARFSALRYATLA
jgi:sugar phosphate isomerase/epimerase